LTTANLGLDPTPGTGTGITQAFNILNQHNHNGDGKGEPVGAAYVTNTPAGIITADKQQGVNDQLAGFIASLQTSVGQLEEGGWVPFSGTLTRVSNTQFTITGDQTGINSFGDYIRITQTVNRYFALFAVSYNSGTGLTTYTILGDPAYPLINAPIINPCYSKIALPSGYPHVFDYAPTLEGWSSAPTNCIYRWSLKGNLCTVFGRQKNPGTSNANYARIYTPWPPKLITDMVWQGMASAVNPNVESNVYCAVSASSPEGKIGFYKGGSSTGWATSGDKGILWFNVTYEIGVV
jgi:hypothetical protein